MSWRRWLLLACVVLTACGAPEAEETGGSWQSRLPTRRPTAAPTDTPFAVPAPTYYDQGIERQQHGDAATARQYFTWAIQRDPGFVKAYVARGALFLAEGRLNEALRDADVALQIEDTPKAYVLRGEALRGQGRDEEALEAFDQALRREPGLQEETFRSRWQTALALEDEERLTDLGSEYAARHPQDSLSAYYQGFPSLLADEPKEAIAVLVEGIEKSGEQTALDWYLLGRAYLDIEAWQEAVLSLETARDLLERNDSSMVIHTEQPVADLFAALGRAYLGARRCADAESMISYALSVGASDAQLGLALEEARICPTPTPLFWGRTGSDEE